MKILVTGGSGYIGTTLVPLLLEKGHSVVNLDNLMYGQAVHLDACRNPKFQMVFGDARDKRVVTEALKGVDAVLPLACYTGAPICDRDPLGATQTNFEAIKMIADLKSKDQALIYPCTNSGYGVGREGIHCDEESPLNPVSLYGKLKVDAEKYLLDRGDSVTFRFATIFGPSPRMRLDLLVNDFTFRAVRDKYLVLFEAHFKRNYLHVIDAARAFLHVLENYAAMKGKPYNVGLSDANLSKLELCQMIQKYVPGLVILTSEIGQDVDKRNYIISNARIEATGFKPEVSLGQGIEHLIKAYKIIRLNQHSNL